MRPRRHLRAVRATVVLLAVQASCVATNARVSLRHRRGGTRIPPGVHRLVALRPDGTPSDPPRDVTIDLTAHEHLEAGAAR